MSSLIQQKFSEWFTKAYHATDDAHIPNEDHSFTAFRAGFIAASPSWQPIESAPKKEDVLILAYFDGLDLCDVVWWHETVRTIPAEKGWYDGCNFHNAVPPTHWMPLPPT